MPSLAGAQGSAPPIDRQGLEQDEKCAAELSCAPLRERTEHRKRFCVQLVCGPCGGRFVGGLAARGFVDGLCRRSFWGQRCFEQDVRRSGWPCLGGLWAQDGACGGGCERDACDFCEGQKRTGTLFEALQSRGAVVGDEDVLIAQCTRADPAFACPCKIRLALGECEGGIFTGEGEEEELLDQAFAYDVVVSSELVSQGLLVEDLVEHKALLEALALGFGEAFEAVSFHRGTVGRTQGATRDGDDRGVGCRGLLGGAPKVEDGPEEQKGEDGATQGSEEQACERGGGVEGVQGLF